jgi:hypothetical protein
MSGRVNEIFVINILIFIVYLKIKKTQHLLGIGKSDIFKTFTISFSLYEN